MVKYIYNSWEIKDIVHHNKEAEMTLQAEPAQKRHGVEIGSWWVYMTDDNPEVVIRVSEWSYYGSERGSLELIQYPQLFWHWINDERITRLRATLQDIDELDVVRFWELVDEGEIKQLDQPTKEA